MRKILIICVAGFVILLSSCSEVVSTPEDEVRLNRWRARLKNGSTLSLCFKDDVGTLKIEGKKLKTKLSGLSFVDNDSIIITDSELNRTFLFKYRLKNNKMSLKYSGGKIFLKKV